MQVNHKLNQVTKVRSFMGHDRRKDMEQFLLESSNVFVWSVVNMPSIFPIVITHAMNVNSKVRLMRQKKRKSIID